MHLTVTVEHFLQRMVLQSHLKVKTTVLPTTTHQVKVRTTKTLLVQTPVIRLEKTKIIYDLICVRLELGSTHHFPSRRIPQMHVPIVTLML